MRVVLKRGNDQVVTLVGLKAQDTGQYLNNALVTATLMDSKGKTVGGFQEVPMTHVSGSNGEYEWFIDSITMMLPKNIEYTLEIKAEEQGLNYRAVHAVSVVDGE